jgi:hypothetical protein
MAALRNQVRPKTVHLHTNHPRSKGGHMSITRIQYLSDLPPVEPLVLQIQAIRVVATPKRDRRLLVTEPPLNQKPRTTCLTHSTNSLTLHSLARQKSTMLPGGSLQFLKAICHSNQDGQVATPKSRISCEHKDPLRLPLESPGKVQEAVQLVEGSRISG